MKLTQSSLHGYTITLERDAVIEAETISIGSDVHVGTGTRIEADRVSIGDYATIGAGSTIVTGDLLLADGALLGDGVSVDLSGGRNRDSSLSVGYAGLVGARTYINTCRAVSLDTESALGPGVVILTHSYWQSVLDGYSATFEPVRLERDAFVGAGTHVLPGVTVGCGAVVMANSTVVRDVPAETLVGGVPADVLREKIRKPLDPARKQRMVVRIIDELAERLRARGSALDSQGDGRYRITSADGATFSVRIAEGTRPDPPIQDEIVISMHPWEAGAGSGTVFDLATRVVLGPQSRAVFELRNVLRRFGIRLQPYAWRADYRLGL